MRKLKTRKGRMLVWSGCCCVVMATVLLGYNMYVSKQAAAASMALTDNLTQLMALAEDQRDLQDGTDSALEGAQDMNASEMETLQVSEYDVIGQLSIPGAGINLAVISEWSYDNLKVAPCRFSGTPENKLVLLAHNYDKHFGKLNILAPGDCVYFMDIKGTTYTYEVLRTEMWSSNQLNHILEAGDWDLTLFTCTYGGGSRVVVRCALV